MRVDSDSVCASDYDSAMTSPMAEPSPEQFRLQIPPPRHDSLFINGQWSAAESGATMASTDPSTGVEFGWFARAGAVDVDRAVRAARASFDRHEWSASGRARERAAILLRVAQRLRQRRAELARLETLDSGKLINDSGDDVDEAAFQFEFYAGCAVQATGSTPSVPGTAQALVLSEPVGVVGLITPWNFPLLMASQKVAPALAAGCTVILKPAEQTSATAIVLAELLAEAGVPDGVFNLITGTGPEAGAALVAHGGVDKISFTGSTAVGQSIAQHLATRVGRVSLELGGKSANIIMPDADLDAAFAGSSHGVFWNMGEVCSAGSRVLVHRDIHDQAVAAMVRHAEAVTLGHPAAASTTMGPLVSDVQAERVTRYIDLGQREAEVAYLGSPPSDPSLADGFYIPPMVLSGVRNDMQIAREEIFGPVMSVLIFDDLDEAIAIANDSPYGLAAAVWTQNLRTAWQAVRRLRAGTIWINDSQPAPTELPWGGVKQSGIGRELGWAGFEAFRETKSVYINLD